MNTNRRSDAVFLDDVFESIRDGISVLDTELNILRVNQWMQRTYELTGCPDGAKCYEVFHRRSEPCEHCPSRETLRTGRPRITVMGYPDDGKPDKWFELHTFPCLDASGQLSGVIQHLKDITEQRKTEVQRRRLEEQNQYSQKIESLGQLAGGIAHDFNNLLMGVLGNAGMVRQELPADAPAARYYLDQIEQAAQQAADLTRQILAYSGQTPLSLQPLNLNAIIQENRKLIEISVPAQVNLNIHLEPEPPLIHADPDQLRHMLMNILMNASEAMGGRAGRILLAAGAQYCTRACLDQAYAQERLSEGYYAFVEVSDTGDGMRPDIQHKIFDPFFSTKFVGRGLGLAAVLGIIRAHGGGIQVHSAPGRGSRFKVLFPVIPVDPAGTENGGKPRAERQPGTILVVEAQAPVREVLRHILERFGHTVHTAAGRAECIEIYKRQRERIDLVLLDMNMPRIDCTETFRTLRRLDGRVQVILTSGYNESEAIDWISRRELAGFIQKPYRPAEVIEVIDKALSYRTGG